MEKKGKKENREKYREKMEKKKRKSRKRNEGVQQTATPGKEKLGRVLIRSTLSTEMRP